MALFTGKGIHTEDSEDQEGNEDESKKKKKKVVSIYN